MINKKEIIFCMAMVWVSVMAGGQTMPSGDTWAKVNASGSGTLAYVYFPQPGMIMTDKGVPKGLFVEVLEDFKAFVKTRYGKQIVLKSYGEAPSFPDFMQQVQQHPALLGVANVMITDERKKLYKFTPPLLPTPLVMLTHKDAPTMTSLNQLSQMYKGYRLLVVGGTVHQKTAERIKQTYAPDLQIEVIKTAPEVIKILVAGGKVISILDFPEFVDAVRKQLPLKRQVVELGDMSMLGFVMNKHADWDVVWQAFLTDEYLRSTTYRKKVADNLGATFLSIIKQ